MTPEQAELTQTIQALLATGEPLSFVDALAVVRRAKRAGELTSGNLTALVGMHDHPQATRGARDVLSDFLRATQSRITQQRALAERIIKLNDSGKVARCSAPTKLTLKLPKGPWQVREQQGPLRLEAVDAVNVNDPEQTFVLTLQRAGHGYLSLEDPTAKARQKARFELRLVIE